MTAITLLEMDRLPSVLPAFARAAVKTGSGLGRGHTIPNIEAEVGNVVVDPGHLERYARVCGFATSDSLPLTYPHVLAFPVHMAVFTHKNFPLRLMGLVHVRNEITQFRMIDRHESFSLAVRVGGHRDVHNGIEFDLVTVASDHAGQTLWESASTMLARGAGSGQRSGQRKKPDETNPAEWKHSVGWRAPADIGRRYAMAAGDFNPIHLSAMSAKLFGFARAIAHGMWLKARCVAALVDEIEQPAYRVQVSFKRPVLLPSEVKLAWRSHDQGIDLALMQPEGDLTHMLGQIAYLRANGSGAA